MQKVLQATRGTFIDAAAPTTNFDFAGQLDVGEIKSGVELRRSLLDFDWSPIPANAKIKSAIFGIYDRGLDTATNTRTMRAFRFKRAWVENQCTWNVYSTGNNWGTAGAGNTTSDREATESGNVSLPGTEVAGYVYMPLDITHIQAIIDGSYTNRGFLLQMDTEVDDMHRFDGNGQTNPPIITVKFELPGGFFTQMV